MGAVARATSTKEQLSNIPDMKLYTARYWLLYEKKNNFLLQKRFQIFAILTMG